MSQHSVLGKNHGSHDVINFLFSSEFKDGKERHMSLICSHIIKV